MIYQDVYRHGNALSVGMIKTSPAGGSADCLQICKQYLLINIYQCIVGNIGEVGDIYILDIIYSILSDLIAIIESVCRINIY